MLREVAVLFFSLAQRYDLDLGRGFLVAEFNDLDVLVKVALEGLFGSVLALPLMFFDCGVDTCPAALRMDAARR